jgi:hypothetical protein
MVAKIDTFIVGLILKNEIKMTRMQYDYKEYMCITLPKKNAVFWCDDDKLAIYMYQTRFFIVEQASPDFYIVSNAQYKNSRDDERMLSINTVASLNSFVNSNSPLFLKFKNKDTFMVHLIDT